MLGRSDSINFNQFLIRPNLILPVVNDFSAIYIFYLLYKAYARYMSKKVTTRKYSQLMHRRRPAWSHLIQSVPAIAYFLVDLTWARIRTCETISAVSPLRTNSCSDARRIVLMSFICSTTQEFILSLWQVKSYTLLLFILRYTGCTSGLLIGKKFLTIHNTAERIIDTNKLLLVAR
jgi:hypothetical protein